MSQRADQIRSQRRVWAASGSSHDRLIRLMQLVLPVSVGALVAVLVFAPFSQRGELSFLLSKDAIEVAKQRLRVEQARYRGVDSSGRAFLLSARDSVQLSAADPVVRLSGLNASIAMPDGPATLEANSARYDPGRDSVKVDGAVRFTAADGYRIDTSNVDVDLNRRAMSSSGAVSGQLPIGRFSASRLSANLETRIVRLSGNARLHINQGVIR